MNIPCVFNCGIGMCNFGYPHRCRKCNAINKHRSADCGKTVALKETSYDSGVKSKKVVVSEVKSKKVVDSSYEEKKLSFDAESYRPAFEAKVTGALIVAKSNGKTYFLVQKRASHLVRGGHHYIYPGGSLERNLTCYENSLKELKEEAGLSLNSYSHRVAGVCENAARGTVNFVVELLSRSLPEWRNNGSGSGEVSDDFGFETKKACYGHAWMTLDEIKDNIGENDLVYKIARQALKKL